MEENDTFLTVRSKGIRVLHYELFPGDFCGALPDDNEAKCILILLLWTDHFLSVRLPFTQ